MRLAYLSLVLALGAWLGGCGIKSQQPLGEEVAVFDPAKVNGIWMGPGGLLGVRVLDEKKGLLHVWNAADYTGREPQRTVKCEPPPGSEQSCFSTKFPGACVWRQLAGSSDKSFFYFPEVEATDETYKTPIVLQSDGEWFAIAYALRAGGLKELFDEAAVPGYVDRSGAIVLGELEREHYRVILSVKSGVVDWKDPLPLLKLPPELDPCRAGGQPAAHSSDDGEQSPGRDRHAVQRAQSHAPPAPGALQ